MKFVRPVYLILVFFIFVLVQFTPESLRGAPRPVYEYRIKLGLLVTACGFLLYLAAKTAKRDLKTIRGETHITKVFDLTLTSTAPFVLGPITGVGPCQIRLKIRRIAKEVSRDEIHICWVDKEGKEVEMESLVFSFNKESYEVDITDAGHWSIGIKVWAPKRLSETFVGRIKFVLIGSASNVDVPNAFVSKGFSPQH